MGHLNTTRDGAVAHERNARGPARRRAQQPASPRTDNCCWRHVVRFRGDHVIAQRAAECQGSDASDEMQYPSAQRYVRHFRPSAAHLFDRVPGAYHQAARAGSQGTRTPRPDRSSQRTP